MHASEQYIGVSPVFDGHCQNPIRTATTGPLTLKFDGDIS